MDSLEQEAAVKTALDRLSELLEHNEVIQKYKALKQRVEQNKHLDELIEKIKQAQKMRFSLLTMENLKLSVKQLKKQID
jgi:cell fate (sporulation/competence/biofilm development) regulator YmcA (YheA/YmcA/DUF963 family)